MTFRREWLWAVLGSLLGAAALTWPTLRDPSRTIPADIWDPTLQSWQMAWSGHSLKTDPGALWDANAFYPDSYSYAFSDTLLGYVPAGLIGSGPSDAILRYNIMFVLAHALALAGGYFLARQLGSRVSGALVVALASASAPWRWAQAGHLHVLSTGGIALALAMLARGHGFTLRRGWQPQEARPGWAVAGWLVAAWQITLGFGIGLPFAYVLVVLVIAALVLLWRRRRAGFRMPRRLVISDLVGGAAFAVTTIAMAIPYLKVVEQHPYAERTVTDLRSYSSPIQGFITAPAQSWLWGDLHTGLRDSMTTPSETSLLPGFALYALAIAGLFVSAWPKRKRVVLLAVALGGIVLSMGTKLLWGAGYLPLYYALPGWNAIRTPGRLILWTTLALALLSAGFVSELARRVPRKAAVVLLVPALLVGLEGLQRLDFPVVPAAPPSVVSLRGPALVLPSSQRLDENIMLWTTGDFPRIVNGGSGFTPRTLEEIRVLAEHFPDAASVDRLRELGVREVVVLKQYAPGTPYANSLTATGEGLGISRTDRPDAVVFTLS
ncbi:MAG: hypothetical protein HOU81_25470 [Hamadaea sp.]|uniref:hypothetical protein n=1 Tax=Hamadaea sp. TaxID=2024425 RepID=UPI0017DDB475|nr:hypothetical protein [Hamadaea sp.]NUR74173.1 hypothetical protein [Hamadaea sp.]NUT20503.1 hypothetical protein [Hamadaea sp.]